MTLNYIQLANEIALDKRSKELRSLVLDALEGGGRGHLSSALSLIEIIRVLYDDVLVHEASDPWSLQRDRFILSKGHGCLGLFAVLADHGYFPLDELKSFCQFGSRLGGHPERFTLPGIEFSTGSLGHGFPVGVGMAMASRLKKEKWRTFILMGDGELNEGSTWEAAMHASQHKLGFLTAIVDCNRAQASGPSESIVSLDSLIDKFRSFGFETIEVNGHNTENLLFELKKPTREIARPRAIIAHTTKGKGMVSAENSPEWHHKAKISVDEIQLLRMELET